MGAARRLGAPVLLRAAAAVVALVLGLAGCRDDTVDEGSPPTTDAAPTVGPGAAEGRPDLVVPIDGRPSAVGYGDGVLWVADDEQGVVHRLDPDDGSPLGPPIPVTAAPVALAVGAGRVWVVDPGGTLTGIDASAPEQPALSVPLGGALVDVVVEGERVWVGDIQAGTVRSIDPSTGAPSPPLAVPDGVVRLEPDGDRLWVSGLDRTVTPIDLVTGEVGAPVTVGAAPIGIAARDGELWVANSDDDTVSHLGADGEALSPVRSVGSAPIEVLVDGDDLWVLEQDAPSLTRYPGGGPAAGATTVVLPARPRGLTSTPAGIWVVGVDESVVALVRR